MFFIEHNHRGAVSTSPPLSPLPWPTALHSPRSLPPVLPFCVQPLHGRKVRMAFRRRTYGRRRKFARRVRRRRRARPTSFRRRRLVTRSRRAPAGQRRSYTHKQSVPCDPRRGFLWGIAPKTRVKLRYTARFSFVTTASAAPTSHLFRGTSAWDPEWASGGSTPADWARFQSAYQLYTCNASKCTAHVMPTGCLSPTAGVVTTSPVLDVWLIPQAVTTPYTATTLAGLENQPGSGWRRRRVRLNQFMPSSAARGARLSMFRTYHRTVQHPRDPDSRWANTSANISTDFYWGVYYVTAPLNASWPATIEVTLDYYLTFVRRTFQP